MVRFMAYHNVFIMFVAQSKGTSIKEALQKWKEKNGEELGEAKEIKLYGQLPPIDKMDSSLSTLTSCE